MKSSIFSPRCDQKNTILPNLISFCDRTLNAAYFTQKEGTRVIAKDIFSRLIYSLESLGYSGKKLAVLANEIIFSVRFGELTVSTMNKKPLTINHAISIAIKLVREKRWSTPKLLALKLSGLEQKKAA